VSACTRRWRTPRFLAWCDRTHPCVIAWVPVTDVVTVHDYTSGGAVLRERYGDHAALEHTLAHTQPAYRVVLLPGATHVEAPS
jgi:hypothetical protein